MDRLMRLSFITEYLTLYKKTTAKELAIELNVSKRTIYRDIDLLSTMNVPIYVQSGRNGGIYIHESYIISKTLVNDNDQIHILSALKSLEVTGITANNSLSTKLSNVFQKNNIPSYMIDFSSWGNDVEKEKMNIISNSQSTEKILEFDYTNPQGIISHRKVLVINLNFKKNAWYFKAYCLDKEDTRLFKVSRSDKITLGKEYDSFLYKNAIETPDKSMEFVMLTIKVETNLLLRVQEDMNIDILEKQTDNYTLIQTFQPIGNWLIHYLLSFGSSLEIIAPLSIRKEIIEEINLMKNKY